MPGVNFVYAQLNRVFKARDLSVIYIAGLDHGGPGLVANAYLEGTYSQVYPDVSQDAAGLKRLFIQLSFPGGIRATSPTPQRCYGERVPPLVRRYIKTSLIFLVIGLLLGGYLTVTEFVIGRYPPRLFITAHVHLLLVGFMLMIVMGVATWMFPKLPRDSGRYHRGLAEAVYWLLTLSTATRAVAELAAPFAPSPGLRLVIAAAGLGQIVGAALFVINMWSRVRMPAAAAPSSR